MRSYAYIVPCFLFYFAASAAPTEISSFVKREPKEAGIGVELEVRKFVLANEDPRAKTVDDKMKAAVKGSTLISADPTHQGTTCKQFWDLTAESCGIQETGKF